MKTSQWFRRWLQSPGNPPRSARQATLHRRSNGGIRPDATIRSSGLGALIAQFVRTGRKVAAALPHNYGAALLALGLAALVHWVCAITTGITSAGIFFVYLMAILVAAWRGYGPGLLNLALAVAVLPFVYRPGFTLWAIDPAGLAVLILISLITSYIALNRRRLEGGLRTANLQLDEQVRRQTGRLEEANTALQHRLAEVEALYRQVPLGLASLDTELRYLRVNNMLATLDGVAVGEHLGRRVEEVLPAELAGTIERLCRRTLETGSDLTNHEILAPGKGAAQPCFWAVSCSPVRAENGRSVGVQLVVQDITENKRAALDLADANKALLLSNEALRLANEDLGQFAYIAAHDLQEPLRTVITFSQLLERRVGEKLDSSTRELLTTLVRAGRRMSQLISDVLAYSRAGAEQEPIVRTVNLNDVLTSAMDELRQHLRDTGAQVIRETLPFVEGNPAQLRQVFHNLLGNALKYARSDVPLVITIRASRNDAEWVVSVCDNGRGFRQDYAERIFGIFRRLHGNDVPGSGIGLAICKRIIERHGGRMWAEGQEGRGASFHFTLPAVDDKRARLMEQSSAHGD